MTNELISKLSGQKVQAFIVSHERDDVRDFLLKNGAVDGVPAAWIAWQIQGRQKSKDKLPSWYQTPGIIYPPTVNLEQCSSEATARYKQSLLRRHHAVDLTGGFGVDSYYISRAFTQIDYVEPDETLFLLARNNHQLLSASTIRHHHSDAETFLKSTEETYDLAYIDPSRRHGARKVSRLADCSPDVTALKNVLLRRARTVLIKCSPLLDLRQAYRELGNVSQFIVLAVENEVRELLILMTNDHVGEPTIHAVNLDREGEPAAFAFTWEYEKKAFATYGPVRQLLYEPNAAILKAGAFKLVSQRFGLDKLAPQSHWYTSDEKKDEFPGRIFRVIEQVSLNKKLRDHFPDRAVNIISRNHPLSVDEIRKKTDLAEGGNEYLICTTSNKPIVLRALRVR
jgi:hypothetical protein